MHAPRVILAGGDGAAGSAFTRLLVQRGYRVTLLSQSPGAGNRAVQHVRRDGVHQGPWREALEGACGLVNLTAPSGRHDDGAHTASIAALAEAIAACADAPPVWIQAGSLAIYGNETRTRAADERTPPGSDAAARACQAAENAFHQAPLSGVRRAVYRLGLVLGDTPSSEARARKLAQWAHSTRGAIQDAWVSWIHAGDLARLLYWGLRMEIIAGPYNACVPDAAPLATFARACGTISHDSDPGRGQHPENHGHEAGHAPEPLVRAAPRRFLDIAYQFRNESIAHTLSVQCTHQPAGERAPAVALR